MDMQRSRGLTSSIVLTSNSPVAGQGISRLSPLALAGRLPKGENMTHEAAHREERRATQAHQVRQIAAEMLAGLKEARDAVTSMPLYRAHPSYQRLCRLIEKGERVLS